MSVKIKEVIISILFWVVTTISCFSQTQSEMNIDSYESYEEADKELNSIYQKILIEYNSNNQFIEKLKKAQRIWISYRDAELEMKFPIKEKRMNYGNLYPMCRSHYLKSITTERIKKLRVWLDGIEEGEVCIGSVKMK